jgi:hypothetical protein
MSEENAEQHVTYDLADPRLRIESPEKAEFSGVIKADGRNVAITIRGLKPTPYGRAVFAAMWDARALEKELAPNAVFRGTKE